MGNSNRHHDAARAGVEEEAAREQQCRQDEQMNQLRNAMDQERRDRAEGRREEREKQEAEEKRSNEKMEEELGLLMEQERKYNKEKHKEQMREIEKKMLEGMKKVMEDLEDREKIRNEHMKTMHEPFMKDKQMNQIEAETTVKFEQFKLAEKIAEKEISKLSAADAKRLQEYHANVMSKSTRRNYKPRDTFIAVRNIRSELHHLEHLLEDLKSGTTDIKKSSIKECDLSCQRILAVLENRESFQNSDDFDLWSRQKTLQKMKEINAELQVLLNKFDLLSDDDHSKSHIVRFAAENIEGILSKTKELGFLLHRSWVSICANLQREKQMDILIAPASSHTSNRLPLADLVKEIKKANAELSQNLKSASNLLFPEGISDCKVLRQNSQKTLGTLENCVIQALDQTEAHSSKDLLRLLSSVLSLQVLIEGADEFLVDGLDEKQMELAGEVVDMIRNEQKKLNDAVEKVEKVWAICVNSFM